jgi:hypothetical protein
MKINFLSDYVINHKAKLLLREYSETNASSEKHEVDVVGIASHLGLSIHFVDLQTAYDKNTLGMIVPAKKIILCDISTEPHGSRKEQNERILRFTLAHEIGHYQLHKHYMADPLFYHNLNHQEQSRIEIQANRFGSSIIMPDYSFKARYNFLFRKVGLDQGLTIRELSEDFNVSQQVVRYRIKELGL